jgi:hypothetical protein
MFSSSPPPLEEGSATPPSSLRFSPPPFDMSPTRRGERGSLSALDFSPTKGDFSPIKDDFLPTADGFSPPTHLGYFLPPVGSGSPPGMIFIELSMAAGIYILKAPYRVCTYRRGNCSHGVAFFITKKALKFNCKPVLRIKIHRIHMFLGLPDPDPLVRDMDPDPSIIMQKWVVRKTLIPTIL